MSKSRDEYTWADFTYDLALTTSLTLQRASEFSRALQESGIHPYDALRPVKDLLANGGLNGEALVTLIALNPKAES